MKTLVFRGGKNVLVMAALAVACTAALGATKTYIGTTGGHFNVSSNWMPTGAPANGDDVTLGTTTYTATDDLDVTLDTTEPTGTNAIYNSLTLDSSGLLGYMVLSQTAGTLAATTETIGKATAENTFNQSNGTTNTMATLNIGVAGVSDSYNLSGNLNSTILNTTSAMNVGISGSGTFNQTGGNFEDYMNFDDENEDTVTLGVNASGSGTVNVSGSQSSFGVEALNVGSAGTGVFNQSGGDVNAARIFIQSTSGTATYNYSGGTLENLGFFYIQVGTHGTFNLETGAVLTAGITLNSGGVLKMAGGSFDPAAVVDMEGGTLELQGHSVSLFNLFGPEDSVVNFGTGIIENGATTPASLTLDVPYIGEGPTGPGNIVQFSGVIKDGATGSFGLAVTGGAGFGLGLAGSNNSYSGATSVGATLQAFANNAFSPNSAVTMLAGGVLDASTFSVVIGSLAGTAGTVNVDTYGTLFIGKDNTSTTYAGVLTGGGAITKIGTGTLTLNTSGGTFTGNIYIQSGTLAVGVTNGIPTNAPVEFTGSSGMLSVNADQTLAYYSNSDLSTTNFSNNSTLTVGTNNVNSFIGGIFTGTGTFVITGNDTYTLGFGSGNMIPNTDAGVTIAVNSGSTLDLNNAAGITGVAGPLDINGGTVILSASEQIADTSTVTLTGGTLNLNGFNETIGGLAGSVGNVALNGGTLTLASASTMSYGGSLTGPGSFVKTLGGNFVVTGASTYTGSFTANAGQLTLQNVVAASAFTANSGGTIEFNTATFNGFGAQILSNSSGVVEYLGSTISNVFLRGTGAHTILAGATSTFNGVTTYNSTVITQNGPAIFNNFSNGGTINNSAVLTFNGGTNAGTGIINVNNAFNTQDFGNEGIMNIATGATLTNSVSNLFLEGGSRTYIGTTANHGGTVTLQGGTTIEVNGALLVNDGTISGTTDVNYGGTAEGVGTYGPVNVTFGGVFQPGISSTSIIAGNNTSVSALSGDGTIDNVAAAGNITLNVNTSVDNSFSGTIQNSNGTLGLNLNGGSLTLLTHPIAGGNSTNTYTGGTTITSGSLIIGAINAFPAGTPVLNNGSFFIYANSTTGKITGNGQLTIGSVATGNAIATLAPKSGLSTLASLTITPGSKLDLTNNDLIIHNGDLGQTIALLAQGYSHGTWSGLTGIASSVAAMSANHATTLGVATGLTAFDGQGVQPSDVLIKYTWLGDANLDGIVNATDLGAISSTGTTWQTGDFNYDGKVNADDYALFMLGSAYGSSTNIAATLPEPAIGMICAGGLLVCSGRRRRI